MTDTCLFCRIVSGEVPASVVAQDDRFMAFRDISPQAPTHVVCIPRAHVASLNEVDDEASVGGLLRFGARVARQEGLAERGWRAVINTNADAGQTVFHLHLHVLGGRKLSWPPG